MTTTPVPPAAGSVRTAQAPPPGPVVDARPRWRRLAPPLAVLAGVAAATAYIGAVDPNEPGHYPLCPTRALFGIDCPGCGSMRAIHALAHGDLGRAIDHNLLLVAVLPLLAWWWVAWVRRAWTGVTPPVSHRQAVWRHRGTVALLVVVAVFGVARWFIPYLASPAG